MAFFKPRKKKISGLYYPESVTVGRISTRQLAKALSDRSTVTLSDAQAVLSELGTVMGQYMAQGKSVFLNGLGSFRYTINAHKQGVEKEDEVSASQILGVRVRFTPEIFRDANAQVTTRSCVPTEIDWMEWGKEPEKKSDTESGDSSSSGGGGDDGNNPL